MKWRKQFSRRNGWHIGLALAFLLLPFLLYEGHRLHLYREWWSFGWALGFFYLNYYYLMPALYFRGEYAGYAAWTILLLFFASTFPVLLIYAYGVPPGWTDTALHDALYYWKLFEADVKRDIVLFALGGFAAFAFLINNHLRRLNEEKINAELSYLKAQINPHFLFNTLNSIYSLSIVHSPKAPDSIVKLSALMRYVLSEASEKYVMLEKEMSYIRNYIDLQQMRLGETASIHYTYNGNLKGKRIAPLVLIPFIENAFKHGVNPEVTSQIDIQISVSETHLYLHVFNLKVPHQYNKADHSGLGLENGKNQLALLYPGKHHLKIEQNQYSFTVNLNLQIA